MVDIVHGRLERKQAERITPERIAELKAVIAGATWLATPTHIDAQRKAALFALLDAAEDRERLRYALKIIAGREPCPDPCMGNVDIAIAALAQEGEKNE